MLEGGPAWKIRWERTGLLKREIYKEKWEQKGNAGEGEEEPDQQVKKGQGAERKLSGGVGAGQGLAGGLQAGKETEQQVEEQVPSGKDGLGKWRKGKGDLAI